MSTATELDDLPPLDQMVVGNLATWAKGRKLEDLEVVEGSDGAPYFPDHVTRFDFKKKQLVDVQVYVRVPGETEMAKARIAALAYTAALAGRKVQDFDEAAAIRVFGEARFRQLDGLFVLERALHKRKDPGSDPVPYMTAENLEQCHPPPALWAALDRVGHYRRMLDTRLSADQLSDPRVFWEAVAHLAKRQDPSFLAVIAGDVLPSFMLTMASELHRYRTESSSPPSSASSTSTG